jgi:phosphopantetheine adenylyltransferase/dephospho-CoA kinase
VLVIGLTGGIGSGKSTVAELLEEHGAAVLDADKLGHEIYEPGRPAWTKVLEAFGPEISSAHGYINRKILASLVFGDVAAMKRLTDIVWPLMKAEMRNRLELLRFDGARIVVLEAAVLLEAHWEDVVDEVWVVSIPPEVAVSRLVSRGKISEDEAWARVAAQMTNAERTVHAGIVLDNSGDYEALSRQVDALWQSAVRRAA